MKTIDNKYNMVKGIGNITFRKNNDAIIPSSQKIQDGSMTQIHNKINKVLV